MSLFELQKGTNLIETLDNYSLSKQELTLSDEMMEDDIVFSSDMDFWQAIMKNPEFYYNKKICLNHFVISDWVARVPGLFWSLGAKALRDAAENHVATKENTYTEYFPAGKSRMVMGGMGTLLFPPNDDGKAIMSASSHYDASLGVPLLVFPDVAEKLRSSALVRIIGAKWQAMETSWSKKFISGYDVPRGYLVIDSVDKVDVIEKGYPVFHQPFSIMQYEQNGAYLYDYVYMTADASSPQANAFASKFFEDYANKDGRYGEYLIASDMVNQLFEAKYQSPSDLNRESEKANMNLLYNRIKGAYFNNVSLDQLIIKLPEYYDSIAALKTLAKKIGINTNKIADGSAIDYSSQLINLCIKYDLTEVLIDRLTSEYNEIFK